MTYIMRTPYGAFWSVCQSPLGSEEDDWDECDACGGEGLDPEAEDEDGDDAPALLIRRPA